MKKRKNPTDSSSYTQPQDLPASKHFKASDTASKHHNDNSSSIPLSTITNTVFRNLQPPLASPLIHIHPSETPVVTIPTAEQFTSSMRDFILQDAARGFNYGTDERFLKQVVYKRIMKKEQLLQSLNKIIPCSLLESTHFHMKPNNNDKPPEVCKPSQNTLQWNDLLLQAHLLYSQLIKKKKNKKNTQEIDWICQKAYDKVIDKVSLNFCMLDNLHKARQVIIERLKLLLNS
jgi:hypothetical protein